MAGDIDMGHARALLPLDGAGQVQLANRAAGRGLSVREVERLVHHELKPRSLRAKPAPDRDLQRIEEALSDALGATVKVKANRKGAGTLSVGFSSLDQLDALLARLG